VSARFIDFLRGLTAKTTSIDGSEQVHIDSAGLSQKATLLDVMRYVLANGFSATDLNIAGRQYIRASTKTLTESSATGIVDIALTAGKIAGGRIIYTVEANDATDYQAITAYAGFSVVNKGGTLTHALSPVTEAAAVSAGTLTCAPTLVAGTNKITLSLNAVSSLTQTTLRVKWQLIHDGNATITAL
jgi:hypothetical protein